MTTRIPPLDRDDMEPDQRAIHDRIVENKGRVGFGPAIGYAYSAGVWGLHNTSSQHLLDCALSAQQVRIVSLMTVRHWKAAYPWSAQARTAIAAGVDPTIVEAINEGRNPQFEDISDRAVYETACELLATGTLSDAGFEAAKTALGYKRMVELIGTIGHFCTTALMANVVGATPAANAPSHLRLAEDTMDP